jgi:hypothetical protein
LAAGSPPSHKSHHDATGLSRWGIVIGAGIGGAVAFVGLVMFLIWLSTKL